MTRKLLQGQRGASAWGSPFPSRLSAWLAVGTACVACVLVLDQARLPSPIHGPTEAAAATSKLEAEPRPPFRCPTTPPAAVLRGFLPANEGAGIAIHLARHARSSNVADAFESDYWGERRLRALAEVLDARPSAVVRARVVDEMARLVVRHRSMIGAELVRLLEARVATLGDPRLAYRLERSLPR